MINIMLKNVDLNDKWWIELIKTINYFRNRFSMTNKSIIFYEIDTKKKSFFVHFRRIETTNYAMKRKSITKWKKFVLKSFFVSQAAVQKQDCGITWYDYSHVMWLRWLCIERNNFDSSTSTYIECCSS
jgi:hypothetical protein